MFQNAAAGFFLRKLFDWGGWLGIIATSLLGFYNTMTPTQQATIGQLLNGHWQSVTLGSLVPLIILVWANIASFRATTKAQVVTSDGKKIAPVPGTEAMKRIETQAIVAPKQPTLWQRITSRN